MTTAYTSLLGLALPVTGELSGTWGDTVNTAITALLDSAVAGTTTISTDADITLSTTTGAANEAREAIILWTAAGSVTRNITAPAQSKTYIVINKSSSTQSIVLRGVGPTTGVTIVVNEKAVCAWNGSDFVKVASTVITNLTGTLPVANGGTGLTTTPANGALDIGNGTGFTRTTLTAGSNITITNGAGSISIAGNAGTVTSVAATVPSFLSIAGSPITTSGTLAITYSGTALPVANGGTGVTTSTGTGSVVLSTSPTLVSPALGTPASGVVTNLTGTASININGTVGATTTNTGAFTTLTTSGNVGIGGGTPGSNPKLSLYGGIRFLTNEAASATYTGIGSIDSDMVSISTSGFERMRVTNQGGVSFGATGTAYGTTGEVLISQGNSAPVWGAAGIGVGQTWQNVTGSRSAGTTYTNSTGKPISVSLSCLGTASASFSIDGIQVSEIGGSASVRGMMGGIVPNGSSYIASGSGLTIDVWAELR